MERITISLHQPRIATGLDQSGKMTKVYGVFVRNGEAWIEPAYACAGEPQGYMCQGGDPDKYVEVTFRHPWLMWGSTEEIQADFYRAASQQLLDA